MQKETPSLLKIPDIKPGGLTPMSLRQLPFSPMGQNKNSSFYRNPMMSSTRQSPRHLGGSTDRSFNETMRIGNQRPRDLKYTEFDDMYNKLHGPIHNPIRYVDGSRIKQMRPRKLRMASVQFPEINKDNGSRLNRSAESSKESLDLDQVENGGDGKGGHVCGAHCLSDDVFHQSLHDPLMLTKNGNSVIAEYRKK